MHRKPCVERKEENYFFALSKYQAQLEELCSSPGTCGRARPGPAAAALPGSRLVAPGLHQPPSFLGPSCVSYQPHKQQRWQGGQQRPSPLLLPLLLRLRAGFVQPESRRNEVLGWVKSGVRDFSISRAAVEWGIPIPRDPKQTVYVWFDALNGYLSGVP